MLRGKPIFHPRAARAPSAPRGKGGERRAELLDLIRQQPDGLTADQIDQSLNATDKKDKQAIANLLANMKKEGALHQEQRRGPHPNQRSRMTLVKRTPRVRCRAL